METKNCNKCKIVKDLCDFNKKTKSKDGQQPYCRLCQCAEKRNWNEENREHINQYKKERRQADSSFRKSVQLTELMSKCLKKNQKKSQLEQYIGCSLEFLYQWLEFPFKGKFNWSEYGSIYEIDHRIPKAFYDHNNNMQVHQCWHWKNLKLITREENISKGSKVDLNAFYENALLAEDFIAQFEEDDEDFLDSESEDSDSDFETEFASVELFD